MRPILGKQYVPQEDKALDLLLSGTTFRVVVVVERTCVEQSRRVDQARRAVGEGEYVGLVLIAP